jgi:hypothetical protein
MALKVPDVGDLFFLADLISNSLQGAWCKLYRVDIVPTFATVLGDITEANFSGYVKKVLNSWSPQVILGIRAYTENDPVNFTHNGGATANSIFGYYVVDSTESELLFLEKDSLGPIVMAANLDNYRVTASFTGRSEY